MPPAISWRGHKNSRVLWALENRLRLILNLFSNIYRHPGDPLLFVMVAQVAWQNDLAEYKIQRSITFLPIEIQLLSIHHWVSLEKSFHLVYYMMKNIECKKLACYPYWLIINCFTSRSRIFHLYGDVNIAGERLQNLGLWSVHDFEIMCLMTNEQIRPVGKITCEWL